MVFPFIAVGLALIFSGTTGLFFIKRGEEYAQEHPDDPSWYPGKQLVGDVGNVPKEVWQGLGAVAVVGAALALVYLMSKRR